MNFDLAIEKTLDPATEFPVFPGDEVTFFVEIMNQGTVDATDVEVTDYIPSDMSFVNSPDFASTTATTATATIASLAAGASTTLEITLMINV